MSNILQAIKYCEKEKKEAIQKAKKAGPITSQMWEARALAMTDVIVTLSKQVNGKQTWNRGMVKGVEKTKWKGKNLLTTIKPPQWDD